MNTPENLIDVLSEESFTAEHLPGAQNFCIYEVAFLEKVAAAFPDRTTPLTVYGWSAATHEAPEAAACLLEAGYVSVAVLDGGLTGWKSGGGPIEGNGASLGAPDGPYFVDPESSVIFWTGRNLFNFHAGELRLTGGELEVSGNQLTGGRMGIAMDSIRCTDITDQAMNGMLIAHLRSAHFFAVDRFPAAELVIIRSETLSHATPGQPNLQVTAQLTLRGETHELTFAVVAAQRDDHTLIAQGTVAFDRTLWGSTYGSGKFFARLGKHVVNDLIDLQVRIVASRVA